MGRPGVYGRELKLTPDGHFLGCNIGFNFFSEHEHDTLGEVEGLNNGCKPIDIELLKMLGADKTQIKRLKAYIKEYNSKLTTQLKMFGATPFAQYLLHPCCNIISREVRINNNPIKDKYDKFLTINGDYTFIQIGGNIDAIKNKLKSKTSFTERDFLYMEDYARGSSSTNIRFMQGLASGQIHSRDNNFCHVCGSWGTNSGIVILVYRDEHTRDVGKELVEAVKNGYVGCVSALPTVFSNRGCCLINLEEAYRPRLG